MATTKTTTVLRDVAEWQTLLNDALRQTGGPLTQTERDWADGILDPGNSSVV